MKGDNGMEIKKDVLEALKSDHINAIEWMPKKARGRGNEKAKDISIRCGTRDKKRRNYISLTIRNSISDLICPNGGGILAGVYKSRVYFVEDFENGYKLGNNQANNNDVMYAKMGKHDELIPFVGDYDLKHDEFLDMYYIERE